MTLRELIRLLESHPADLSPEQISVADIRLNTGRKEWEGCHGDVEEKPGGLVDNSSVVEALILRRVSN